MLKLKPKIIIDISNIAGHYNESPPKMKNIHIMYNTLKYKYWIIGIADWKLYDCIDCIESYKYYLKRRIIVEAPPGIIADILIIMMAKINDCLILTNDKLRDHEDLIPSKSWLKNHRITFNIIKGEFKAHLPNK